MTTHATTSDVPALPALAELWARSQFVAWNYETRENKQTKVPIDPHDGGRASSTDPATGGSATHAEACRLHHGAAGIGFVVTSEDPFVGIDLDHALDADGALTPDAAHIVALLDSYTEITPSGHGVRVWVKGRWTSERHRLGDVEVYDRARFFTFTARHLDGTPQEIHERQAQLDTLRDALFPDPSPLAPRLSHPPDAVDDAALLQRAMQAKNGDKFSTLWHGDASAYPSRSEADLALCSHLTYWTNGDAARMDRLLPLLRPHARQVGRTSRGRDLWRDDDCQGPAGGPGGDPAIRAAGEWPVAQPLPLHTRGAPALR